MTWPPPVQPTSFVDSDVMQGAHPDSHNSLGETLNADFKPEIDRIGGVADGNTAAIADISTVYRETGGAQAEIWVDGAIDRKDASGAHEGYMASINDTDFNYSDKLYTDFNLNTGGWLSLGPDITVDVSNNSSASFFMTQARATAVLQGTNGEGFGIKIGWEFDDGGVVFGSDNFYGYGRNLVDPGTVQMDIHSMPQVVYVPWSVQSVRLIAFGQAWNGTVIVDQSAISAFRINL